MCSAIRDNGPREAAELALEKAKVDLEKKMIELEMSREKIKHEIELSKHKLELESMRHSFELETLSKKHAWERSVQEMEFQAVMKMLDSGMDPTDLVYTLSGISAILRNDKSEDHRKFQREVARHKLALKKKGPGLSRDFGQDCQEEDILNSDAENYDSEPRTTQPD